MPRSHQEVEVLLIRLEQSMRAAKLWSDITPSKKSLSSVLPFACDQLLFEQWLQYIFTPKMTEIVKHKQTLPTTLLLLPMAEQSESPIKNKAKVLDVIAQIDRVFRH
jgi:uncharacterized protein YqcC (DUF446 family)